MGTLSGRSTGDLVALAFLGWFVGLMFGGFLHNTIAAVTPLRTGPGTLQRIEREYSTTGPTDRVTHVLEGRTDAGEAWRIVDEDAFAVVQAEGYPQRVVVGIGAWTGNAERVTGATWEVDQQSTGSMLGFGGVLAVLAGAGVTVALVLGQNPGYGAPGAALFAVCYFVLGGYTGEVLFGWVQSG